MNKNLRGKVVKGLAFASLVLLVAVTFLFVSPTAQAAGACFSGSSKGVKWENNEWHHYVVTYDDVAQQVTFYLDGVKRGTFQALFITSHSGYLLGTCGIQEGLFDGLIDELIVFSEPLTEADVQALYNRKEYTEDAKLSFDNLPACN